MKPLLTLKNHLSPLRWLASVSALCAFMLPGLAQAAPTQTEFPNHITIQGTQLTLHGKGIRYKAMFKVYDLALYTTTKSKSAEAIIAQNAPVRLAFVALRDIPGTDLGRLFLQAMRDNSPPEMLNRHVSSTQRLIEVFSGRRKLAAGDSFAMEYQPGKGTYFYIVGEQQGAPIGNHEYFQMVMRIWLGNIPADFKLKEGLLDIKEENRQ